MEYIDSQVDINDDEHSQTKPHIGQRIHAHIDVSMSFIDEKDPIESTTDERVQPRPIIPKIKRRDSDRSFLHRQASDISLNRFLNETSKPTTTTTTTTTELKGRDHILRVMKTTVNAKPIMDLKNRKFVQEMLAKRHEKQEVSRPVSDFALKYGLVDHNGKKFKSRKTSDLFTDMEHQLEGLKSTLTKRQAVEPNSSLLRIIKLESVCNQLLCYCQYVTDREDVVLFLDPKDEQAKSLAINDEIRIGGESRLDFNLPELGSVALGITGVRKESSSNNTEEDVPIEIIHTYDFNCSCNKCTSNDRQGQEIVVKIDSNSRQLLNSERAGFDSRSITLNESRNYQASDDSNLMTKVNRLLIICFFPAPIFDLISTFPRDDKSQQPTYAVETVYDSFTLALMSKRKFDLRATIIIFDSDQNNNRYIFVVRDGIGNCLQIMLNDVNGLQIKTQTQDYIFHQIEFIERIESPKESNRWPYQDYVPPKKLFCFKSTNNQVSLL
ncbi:unnamed protein product [Rotaria socialis]|nr:unnamed protein product [Rotaria socialis]CAF4400086.1 unnamed protein product [Rotaria socialis]